MCGGKSKSAPAPAPAPAAPVQPPGYAVDQRGKVTDATSDAATPLTTFGSELSSGG